MSISHARVAVRLALAFGVVCLVMSLSAAVGIWRLAGLQDIADDLGGASSERALLARELHAIVVLSSARAETLLELDNNPTYAARIDADRKTTSARSSEVRKRLDELAADPESQALFDAIDKAGNGFRTVRDDLVKRRKTGEALPRPRPWTSWPTTSASAWPRPARPPSAANSRALPSWQQALWRGCC